MIDEPEIRERGSRPPDRDRFLNAIATQLATDGESRRQRWRDATPAERIEPALSKLNEGA